MPSTLYRSNKLYFNVAFNQIFISKNNLYNRIVNIQKKLNMININRYRLCIIRRNGVYCAI